MTFYDDLDKSNLKEYFKKLGNICLKHLMLSSDSYVRMIELNMNGFKRLHRYLSKKYHNLYLKLQKEMFEYIDEIESGANEYKKYIPKNIKEHLISWNQEINNDLNTVGELIKNIFNEGGFIPCTARELQKILYHNIIKNKRAIQQFTDCDWDYEIIYEYDYRLHHKMKEIEEKNV